MPWDEREWNQDLLTFYRSLIRLRRDEPVLRRGTRRTVHLDTASDTYAYLQGAGERDRGVGAILTAFNGSEDEREIQIGLPDDSPGPSCLLSTDTAPDVKSIPGGISVSLAAMSAAIVRL
jgi:glycosidase